MIRSRRLRGRPDNLYSVFGWNSYGRKRKLRVWEETTCSCSGEWHNLETVFVIRPVPLVCPRAPKTLRHESLTLEISLLKVETVLGKGAR